jgi:Spy/CpxP family protein refolding chaperone
MNKRILLILAVAALALSHDVVAQQVSAVAARGMSVVKTTISVDSNGNGNWIATKKQGNEVVVWASGFGKLLELTQEQANDLQDVIENLQPPKKQDGLVVPPQGGYLSIENMRKKLDQVLSKEQQLKHTEISFQAGGGLDSHHLNDQLLDVVNLTDAQKEQIRKIVVEFAEEDYTEREKRGAMKPFDWQNSTREERDKYVAAMIADQNANKANDEARIKKYAEKMKAVLTPEQQAKAEKLTAEIPALRDKFMGRKRDASEQVQSQPRQTGQAPQPQPPGYTPGAGSWQPGMPLPVESPPSERPRRFPRSE